MSDVRIYNRALSADVSLLSTGVTEMWVPRRELIKLAPVAVAGVLAATEQAAIEFHGLRTTRCVVFALRCVFIRSSSPRQERDYQRYEEKSRIFS